MEASTVLEFVRMSAAGFGEVLALLFLVASNREFIQLQKLSPSSRDEVIARREKLVGLESARIRAFGFGLIQFGMLIVAYRAYYTVDEAGMISALALWSNMNQLFVIGIVTVLTIWDWRDVSTRMGIREIADFTPLKPQKRAFRGTVEKDD